MSKDSAAKRDRKLLLEGFFSSFDEKPIASASIGQVHSAVLKAGSHRVVVKLVYTEIKQTMDVDLDNMRRGMLLAMKTLKVKANPMPIVHEIYKSFPTECNFLNELEYLNCIRSNMAKRGDAGKVVVPNCHTHITTQNMLVLEHLDGKTFSKLKIDSMSAAELAAARRALIAVIDEIGKEIVLDGLFQYACIRAQCCDAPLQLQCVSAGWCGSADPHPGNVMLLADGRAALLDFGQCKRLDRTQRAKVAQLMLVLNCRNLKMLKYGMEMTQVQFIQVQISVVVPTLCRSPLCVPVAMRTEHSTAF